MLPCGFFLFFETHTHTHPTICTPLPAVVRHSRNHSQSSCRGRFHSISISYFWGTRAPTPTFPLWLVIVLCTHRSTPSPVVEVVSIPSSILYGFIARSGRHSSLGVLRQMWHDGDLLGVALFIDHSGDMSLGCDLLQSLRGSSLHGRRGRCNDFEACARFA